MLKIPPRNNGTVPIKFRGYNLQDQEAYFISNQHTKKELDPKIHIFDGIYNIKGKSSLYVMVANYTNKHIIFNKGQCIGHMESTIDRMPHTPVKGVTTQKMMDDEVRPDTFKITFASPPLENTMLPKQIIGLIQNTICKR